MPDSLPRSFLDVEQRVQELVASEAARIEAELRAGLLAAQLEEAKRERQDESDQVAMIIGLFELFLAFLTVLVVLLGIGGWAELRRLRQWRETLEEESTAALRSASESAEKISEMSGALKTAWAEWGGHFEQLEIRRGHFVVGDPLHSEPPMIEVRFEDLDRLLVTTDYLGIAEDAASTSRYYLELARYWRNMGSFARALTRVRRAVELNPGNSKYRVHLSRTLATWASSERLGTADREHSPEGVRRLQEAIEAIEEAVKVRGGHNSETQFHLGWVYDEQGRDEEAIAAFREARNLARKEGVASVLSSYNLSCVLTRAGRLEEAAMELHGIAREGETREMAERDDDLKPLRESQHWAGIWEGDED